MGSPLWLRLISPFGNRLLVLLVGVSVLFGTMAASQPREPLLVATVAADGRLLPIAVNHEGGWWDLWPFHYEGNEAPPIAPASLAELPASWLPPEVAFPNTWIMWPLFEQTPGTIQVSRFEKGLNGGMEFIAARTNFSVRGSRWEKLLSVESDAGIAVSGAAEIGQFEPVAIHSAEGRSIVSDLRGRFDAAEIKAIEDRHTELSQPGASPEAIRHPDTAQRRRVPFQGALARAVRRDPSGRWYSVQIIRTYGKPRSLEECTPFTSFDAIVVSRPGVRLVVKSLSAFATDVCGHHEQTTWLATLHWQGPLLWIGRTDGEGFEYGLVDPNAADPHFMEMKRRR